MRHPAFIDLDEELCQQRAIIRTKEARYRLRALKCIPLLETSKPPRESENPTMPTYPELQLFIAGEWKNADGQPVLNPADESVLGTVPHATRADLDAALTAAQEGLRVWRHTAPAKRADIILKAARLARERVEEMAIAMTLEQGKPIAQSRL